MTIDLNRTRYLTLLGTIITQFALGSVYTWSLFNAQLSDKLDEPVSQVAFAFGLLSLSLAVASATTLIASNAHATRDASALPSNSSRSRNELSLVVPYTAGGPLDRSARKLTQETTALGNINVLNVAGEGGATGAAMVARAGAREPMLLMGAVATHAILPWLNPQLPYDPLRDFQPLILVARMPHVLVMRSELAMQWRIYTPEDLLRFMSKHRQPLRYASAGNGSIGHISGEMLKSLANLRLPTVQFEGASAA